MPYSTTADTKTPSSTTKLSDVARIAGVSVSTASRALTRPDMVSPDTREAVQQAAATAGYHPNLIARSLRTQSTNSICVLLPNLSSPFYPEIVRGLDWAAHERGYSLMLGLTGDDAKRQASYCDIIRRQRPDGVVVLGAEIAHMLGGSGQISGPAVLILERVEGSPHASVTIDDRDASAKATRHLIGLGHQRIAHIAGIEISWAAKQRLRGYQDALAGAGIAFDPALVAQGNFAADGGSRGMAQLMALVPPPTAVFCANDETAYGAMQHLEVLGKRVPRDVSVVGFDDLERSATTPPPLTTVRSPRFEIGITAMKMLFDSINGKPPADVHAVLPADIVVRESTCPPQVS